MVKALWHRPRAHSIYRQNVLYVLMPTAAPPERTHGWLLSSRQERIMILEAIKARMTPQEQLAWLNHLFGPGAPAPRLAGQSWDWSRLIGSRLGDRAPVSLWKSRQQLARPCQPKVAAAPPRPSSVPAGAGTDTFKLELIDGSGRTVSLLAEIFGEQIPRAAYRTGESVEVARAGGDIIFLAQRSELL